MVVSAIFKILWREALELLKQIILKGNGCLVCTLKGILGCSQVRLGKDGLLSKVPTLAERHGGLLERGVE